MHLTFHCVYGCSSQMHIISGEDTGVWDEFSARPPQRGDLVDSIAYYTLALENVNESVTEEQKRKIALAELGNHNFQASKWIDHVGSPGAEHDSEKTSPQVCPTSDSYNGRYGSLEQGRDFEKTEHSAVETASAKETIRKTLPLCIPNSLGSKAALSDNGDKKDWRLLDDAFLLVRPSNLHFS